MQQEEEEEDSPRVLKTVLCGPFGCGKTSLAARFARQTFSPDYKATIGVEFYVRTLEASSRRAYKFHIWDTSGQERYAALIPQWFRGAQVYCFLFNVNSRESFEWMAFWLQQAHWETQKNSPALGFLVATQTDRPPTQRQVTRDEAVEYALSQSLQYAETSALTGDGVQELFEAIMDACETRPALVAETRAQRSLTLEETVLLTQQEQPPPRKRCGC